MTRVTPAILLAAATLLLTVGTEAAWAVEYYVSNACNYDGNGRAAFCATSAGAPGAHNNLQAFMDATTFQPDDILYIRAGTGEYVSTGPQGRMEDGGFHIKGSGTPGHPITIRNFPGETPALAFCPASPLNHTVCNSATLTAGNSIYLRISGLKVRGLLMIRYFAASIADLRPGIEIDHMEITQGWTGPGDGNWAGLRIEGATGAWIHHNYIHDIQKFSDSGSQSSSAGIKLGAPNSIIEFNTVENVHASDYGAGFDDKWDAVNNIWRYNRFVAVRYGGRIYGAPRVYAIMGQNEKVYGNVFDHTGADGSNDGPAVYMDRIDGPASVYNNTCVGFSLGVVLTATEGHTLALNVYNNIVYQPTTANLKYDSGGGGTLPSPLLQDYNAYASGKSWYIVGTTYSTLANVIANTPYDDHSLTAADFGFVNAAAGDYHLTASSVMRAAGRVGGVPGGAAVDPGAYFDGTTCVGHRCGSSPGSPTAVQIRGIVY